MATVLASWRLIEEVLRENTHRVFRALWKSVPDAGAWYGGELKVHHMLVTAPIARRYSFTVRPH